MKKIQQFIRALAISLCLITSPALANDYGTALSAYLDGDHQTAFALFSTLAEQGDAGAQFNLGVMYEFGRGNLKNGREAFRWYKKAAEQGVAEAQFNLGNMYRKGEGTAKDDAEAFKWYKKAAEQGVAEAQNSLGVMYEFGRGTLKNGREAFRWFKKAAEQGNALAQLSLSEQYADRGDYIKAHQWANIAQFTGGKSLSLLQTLEESMSQADISKAEKKARICLESGYTDCE